MARTKKWKREELVELFEMLIDSRNNIVSHNDFRGHLDRDRNLYTNQIIRQANGNIAYRSVDCDVFNLSDDDFWDFIDGTEHSELIEENAAVAIMKMVNKLDLND